MVNEKRLIDANDLMAALDDYIQENRDQDTCANNFCADVCEVIKETIVKVSPTVEEVHGYWIGRQLDNFRKYEVKCSECGWTGIENYDSYVDPSDFNYCPNCGAKMDGDGNG